MQAGLIVQNFFLHSFALAHFEKYTPSSSSSCMAVQLSVEFWPSQPTFLSILFYLV